MFKQEIERLTKILITLDPTAESYGVVLNHIDRLIWMANAAKEPVDFRTTCPPGPISAVGTPGIMKITPAEEPVSTQPEPVAEPIQPDVVAPKASITYEELRAIMQAKSAAGVTLQPIITKYVPEGKPVKLSNVPKENYAALAEEVSNAQ